MNRGESQQLFESPEEALEHYGVKGMRWGVRKKDETKGQTEAKAPAPSASKSSTPAPAPSASKSSTPADGSSQPVAAPLTEKQQAKVTKFLEQSKIMETRIAELKLDNKALEGTRNLNKLYERKINNDLIKQTERQRDRAVKDAEAVQNGKLTSKQKQVVAGAVVVTAIIGAAYIYRGQQSGAFNSWQLMAQARLRGQKVPFNINKELSGKMSADDLLTRVAKPVNPFYSNPGGKMNCRRSTYAYELRRRGFDVRATTSAVGWGQSESGVINALTTEGRDYFRGTSMSQVVVQTGGSNVAKGDKRIAPGGKILLDGLRGVNAFGDPAGSSSSAKVLTELARQPEGARGEVLFKFPGFGHSMAYEIVGGKPHIFDSQKGQLYDAAKRVESKWDGFTAAEIRRLDNLPLDYNFLTRWAANA